MKPRLDRRMVPDLLAALPRNRVRLAIPRITRMSPFEGFLCSPKVNMSKRVIVTPAVYPRLVEFLHFDIQSTGQKSHCVSIL